MFERPSAYQPFTSSQGSALSADGRAARLQRESGWLESSWELSHGLEISDLEGELPEEFLRPSMTPPS